MKWLRILRDQQAEPPHCANCRFAGERAMFTARDGSYLLSCQRHAPTQGRDFCEAGWPHVKGSDWCGEWAAKE